MRYLRLCLMAVSLCFGKIASVDSQGNGLPLYGNRFNQVEYANKAAMKGGTILALRSNTHGIMLSLRNKPKGLPILSQPSKIRKLTDHYAIGTSGIIADANHISNQMFADTLDHQTKFDADPPLSKVSSRISSYIHRHTLASHYRPFAIALCLLGYDESCDRMSLYQIDPLGNCLDCKVSSIGRHSAKISSNWMSFSSTHNAVDPLDAEFKNEHELDNLSVVELIRRGVDVLRKSYSDTVGTTRAGNSDEVNNTNTNTVSNNTIEGNNSNSRDENKNPNYNDYSHNNGGTDRNKGGGDNQDESDEDLEELNCDTLEICVVGKNIPFRSLSKKAVEAILANRPWTLDSV